jgi:hypothetical protein
MSNRIAMLVICLPAAFSLQAVHANETSHFAFAREYARELGVIERLRASAESESKQKEGDSFAQTIRPLTMMIHYSTSMQIELGGNIAVLKGMQLDGRFASVAGDLVASYQDEIELLDRLREISKVMMSDLVGGSKPDHDYGAMVAEVPQLRASLESVNKQFVALSGLVFAALVDIRPDKEGHVSHLIITRDERAELLRQLTSDFGSKLAQKKGESSVTDAAGLLSDLLKKDFKCSDEPW